MGMAASQARYLALVARQSNCEYEGQQINQARLALANQTANLFNQMLVLSVPVPPSTQDYTTVQYSFSDGSHSYVIDNWKQLTSADPDYNYIVTAHSYTDVYTGSMKRMADPQVQISNSGNGISSLDIISSALAQLRTAQDVMELRYNYWSTLRSNNDIRIEGLQRQAVQELRWGSIGTVNDVDDPPAGSYTYNLTDDEENSYRVDVYGESDPLSEDGNLNTVLRELYNMVELGVITTDQISTAIQDRERQLEIDPNDPWPLVTDISLLKHEDGEGYTFVQQAVLRTFCLATQNNSDNKFVVLAYDIKNMADNPGLADGVPFSGYQVASGEEGFISSTDRLEEIHAIQNETDAAHEAYLEVKHTYDTYLENYNALSRPTYIGNCPLTYLGTLSEDEEIELRQVVKDMIAQGINTDIINHFNENEEYLGGVYKFTLYGTTYYTTYENLCEAYESNQNSNNFIDSQYRMPYYNASYISTRIEQQSRALLETDGSGRFTSVRFENDSATYTLNMETVTDDAAYADAMNQYYYENALYDKTVQEINAKTSLIQQEDKELELRLTQLDTERNALKTEIDSVKSVIKDNVESSFKTFGG